MDKPNNFGYLNSAVLGLSLFSSRICGRQFLVWVEMLLLSERRELMAMVMWSPLTLSPHSFLAPNASTKM